MQLHRSGICNDTIRLVCAELFRKQGAESWDWNSMSWHAYSLRGLGKDVRQVDSLRLHVTNVEVFESSLR